MRLHFRDEVRVATFALSQSGTGVRGYHPRKIFGIQYAIWCILRQSGSSYLQAVRPVLRHKHIIGAYNDPTV